MAAALLLPGCAMSALDTAPASPDRPWQPQTTPAGEIIPHSRQDAPTPEPSTGYVLPANPVAGRLPAPPSFDPTHAYDLPELIDIAETHNPETREAWNDARNAALAAGIARSAYLPRITASALGGYQTTNGRESAFDIGARQRFSAGGTISAVSLQWLLFDFGQRAAVVEAADQATIGAGIVFTAAHQRLIHDVSLAYYSYDSARSRASVAVRSLTDAVDVQSAAEDRLKHGIATVIEVAQSRQAAAQARLAKVEAAGAEQDAYATLLTVMGLPALTPVKIAKLPHRKLAAAMGRPIDKVMDDALARRPDVLAAYAAQKASLANVRAARAEFLPKVIVSGTGAYTTGGLDVTNIPTFADQAPTVNLSGRRLGATIIGGITIPLFDGGARSASLARARNQAENAALTLTRVKEEAARQIVLAHNALQTSLAANEATDELLAAAQTTYDATLGAYRSGVGSATDVLVAERQLLEARNASVDARSAAYSAAATLAFAIGNLGAAPE